MVFWASIVGIPFLVLAITAAIRHFNDVPHTMACDVWGLFVAFDATMVLDASNFAKFLSAQDASSILAVIGMFFVIFCAAAWQTSLWKVEPALVRAHHGTAPFPYRTWLGAWATLTAVLATHAALLTGRLI